MPTPGQPTASESCFTFHTIEHHWDQHGTVQKPSFFLSCLNLAVIVSNEQANTLLHCNSSRLWTSQQVTTVLLKTCIFFICFLNLRNNYWITCLQSFHAYSCNFFWLRSLSLSLSQILTPSVRCTGVRLFQHKHEHNGFFKGELQQFVK